MSNMEFHEKLRKLCGERGWTQKELARRLKVSPSTVNGWWEGQSQPKWSLGPALAEALGQPLGYLADDRQDAPPAPEPRLSDGEKALLRLGHRCGIDRAIELLADEIANRKAAEPRPAEPRVERH